MQNYHWDDFHTAFQVATLGSLSKAAKKMQLNHSTVLRQINRLEANLNIKLFIRHQRGYKVTDAGRILLEEMPNIYASFSHLENLMGSVEQNISGNLRITSLVEYSSLLTPALQQFRQKFPQLRIQLISTDETLPLASGAAHVSLRAGPEPQDPDLIARPILRLQMAYYAANSYTDIYGKASDVSSFNQHQWVMPSADKQHIPVVKEILQYIDAEQIVYQSNHFLDIQSAVIAGMGIGLLPEHEANKHPHLQRLDIPLAANDSKAKLWYLYHRDLKTNAKVQALYEYLHQHFNPDAD